MGFKTGLEIFDDFTKMGIISFGVSFVKGKSLDPRPAAVITTFFIFANFEGFIFEFKRV
jgi:hypothetical protein